jgi:hypothetical protein
MSTQYFNGQAYWLCGKYWQRRGKRLHRVVWEHHNGPIPNGYHIHHKDGDRSNNDIANLELVQGSEHLSRHMQEPERRKHLDRAIKAAQDAARDWHGSEEGRKWHSERGKANSSLPPRFPCVCKICGNEFMAKQRRSRICSPVCQRENFRRLNPGYHGAWRRKRLQS